MYLKTYLKELHTLLVRYFDREELRTLCLYLDVDYDSLRGEGKVAKARELVMYLDRRGRIQKLVEYVRIQRPNVSCPDMSQGSLPDWSRTDADIFEFMRDMANLLSIPLDEVRILKRRINAFRIEIPSEAADRLITLYEDKNPDIRSRGMRVIPITHKQPPPATASSSAGKIPRVTTKDLHTFQISFEGKVIQGMKNDLELFIKNTTYGDYKRVTLQLKAPSHAISLDPVEHRFFSLGATGSQSRSLALEAIRAGIYKIQVWVSSVPAPRDGFLHTALQLTVQAPPPKSIVEIEYI